jgi:hypothetical protein
LSSIINPPIYAATIPIVCINWLKEPNLPTKDGGDIELIYTGIIAVEIPITKPSTKRALTRT